MSDVDLRLGRWQDVLGDVECDAVICDPPYSPRVHDGHWPMPGFNVCHRCDNPSCINPKHLYLGTHHENHREKKERKRAVGRGCGGHPRFVGGDAARMLERHDDGESIAQLAECYGVTKEAIKYHIRKRRRGAA